MAEELPFLDSFDHWTDTQATRKWTASPGGGYAIVAGRNGNGFLFSGGIAGGLIKTFSVDRATMTAGLAYKTPVLDNYPIMFRRAANFIVQLAHVGDGRFIVAVGTPPGPYLATSAPSAFVMNINQWYYLEMQVTMTRTTCTYEVRANGSIVPILSGVLGGFDFGAFGAHLMNQFISYNPPGILIDDLYVTESSFLGDIQINVIRPNAAGAYADWVPNGGVSSYDRVNDITPDDDATYVEATLPAMKEAHGMQDVVLTGVVKAIQVLACVKKTDPGAAEIKTILRNAGGVEDLGDAYLPSDANYLYSRKGYLVSPFTGVAFTQAEINGLELGLEKTV